MNNKINIQEVLERIKAERMKTPYREGVQTQAIEMLQELTDNGYPNEFDNIEELTEALLNGACDFNEWALAGFGLIYDADIAIRFCGPKELKRTEYGLRSPHKNGTWIEVYAQAVNEAYKLIKENCMI